MGEIGGHVKTNINHELVFCIKQFYLLQLFKRLLNITVPIINNYSSFINFKKILV